MCNLTHTHIRGACTVVAHCLIGGPISLGGQGREREGSLAPYDDIWGHIPNLRAWVYIFPKAPLGDHRQARGTHINVRKPKVRFSCHGTFNRFNIPPLGRGPFKDRLESTKGQTFLLLHWYFLACLQVSSMISNIFWGSCFSPYKPLQNGSAHDITSGGRRPDVWLIDPPSGMYQLAGCKEWGCMGAYLD